MASYLNTNYLKHNILLSHRKSFPLPDIRPALSTKVRMCRIWISTFNFSCVVYTTIQDKYYQLSLYTIFMRFV